MGSKEKRMIFKIRDAVRGAEYEGGLGKQVKLTYWLSGHAPRERSAAAAANEIQICKL